MSLASSTSVFSSMCGMLLNVCILKALQFCDLYRENVESTAFALCSYFFQHLLLCYVKREKLDAENMLELVVFSGSLSSFDFSFWGLASQGTQSNLATSKTITKGAVPCIIFS